MQTLEFYQSLWAMELRHPHRPEPSAAANFERVAAAGYTGICLDPAIDEIADSLALQPLFEAYGLACMVNVFANTPEELAPLLEMAAALDARQVNIIGGVMPIRAADAVPVLRDWLALAGQYEFPVLLETHRDSVLNDLFYTLELLEALPQLRLCADLSHFVVDREFPLPLSELNQDYIERILARSDSFQGRIAGREQIQLQIEFPQHQAWVLQFRQWWRQGIRQWRERNASDATLRFLCELGPPPYAMTDARGEELSDRWQEALTIRSWVQQIWQE